MATASRVSLSNGLQPAFFLPGQTQEAADKASALLQENHDQYHIFFNSRSFHNHIAHQQLTLFALNASPSELQTQYDRNKTYQRPSVSLDASVMESLVDPVVFKEKLGDEKYYRDFLGFFQQQMEEMGWERVLSEFLFKGDERADDLLVRMYAGLLHPIIHLGFGIEFRQPAIIAEALAQAAVHTDWMGPLLLGAEKAAQNSNGPSKSLVKLLDEIRADTTLSSIAHYDDDSRLRDGIIGRGLDKMIAYLAQYRVSPENLEEKTAEMINAVVYFTGGAQNQSKVPKFDFVFMHSLNCSIFFSSFLSLTIPVRSRIRLLEWKVRTDLAIYAANASPPPLLSYIEEYNPKNPGDSWSDIFARVRANADDGHAAKLVRALANGEVVCKTYEDREVFRVKERHWVKLAHMAIDSVEGGNPTWVRGAGFDEAWRDVPDRERAQL